MELRKTNAMRALDQRRIPYEVVTYSADIHSADGVAKAVGVPPREVFKTLVVLRERGRSLLVMAPGDRELDLRKVAQELEEKSVRMAPLAEAERLTGLKVGGIGALALLNKPFDVYLDRSAQPLSHIYVNGGQRGINLRIAVTDLIRVTGACWIDAVGNQRPR